MDGDRFDALTRALGAGRSRRGVLKGLGAAALGVVGLSRVGATRAADLGNSPCAHFCVTEYPPGPDRGACISAAAQGQGVCPSCGANVNAANICHTPSGAPYCPDFANDPTNCGGCAKVCTTANGTPGCANGVCTTAGCNTGYADCDGLASNGCETNILGSDVNNCGACNQLCPSDSCNAAVCTAGVCSTTPTNSGGQCAPASDACHTASTCDASGHCVAGGAITCPAGDQCNAAANCDPTSGCGNVTPVTNGTPCNSGGGAGSGACQNGTCVANNPCASTCITVPEPQCFWQENYGNYCYVPYPAYTDQASCEAAGAYCNTSYHGACYKWSTSSC